MTDNTNRRASPKESEGLELPPLPEPIMGLWSESIRKAWAEAMQKYAREAVEADRQARHVTVTDYGNVQQPAPAATIDTPEFRALVDAHLRHALNGGMAIDKTSVWSALIAHIDAKLAEARREAGQQEDP